MRFLQFERLRRTLSKQLLGALDDASLGGYG
jgi:hypothetical protein